MSDRIALVEATAAAIALRDMLAPVCERIEIAGSIRRRRADVKDMELVAVPRIDQEAAGDLWGVETVQRDRLSERLAALLAAGEIEVRVVEVHRADGTVEQSRRVGSAYQALVFRGVPVDLFIVRPPAEWGVIFTIRTGPADWSARLVTECQRFGRRVQGGQLLAWGKPVSCPEEADFLRAVGQPWVDPWERDAARVRLDWPNPDAPTRGGGRP